MIAQDAMKHLSFDALDRRMHLQNKSPWHTCHDVRTLRYVKDVVAETVLCITRFSNDALLERPQAPQHPEKAAFPSPVGTCDQKVGPPWHSQCQTLDKGVASRSDHCHPLK